jgi:hypothetical protein
VPTLWQVVLRNYEILHPEVLDIGLPFDGEVQEKNGSVRKEVLPGVRWLQTARGLKMSCVKCHVWRSRGTVAVLGNTTKHSLSSLWRNYSGPVLVTNSAILGTTPVILHPPIANRSLRRRRDLSRLLIRVLLVLAWFFRGTILETLVEKPNNFCASKTVHSIGLRCAAFLTALRFAHNQDCAPLTLRSFAAALLRA